MEWPLYIQFFVSILSIVNPIGAIPLFINITASESPAERNRTGRAAACTVGLILSGALIAGNLILRFFGITISSFRVGGGILILLIGISMLHARTSETKQTDEESQDAVESDTVAVVPLGIPLLAGPGAISAVILYATATAGYIPRIMFALEIWLVALVVWLSLRSAPLIASLLGRTGINVVMRIMGLIMTAVAVEFIAGGLRVLFPILG